MDSVILWRAWADNHSYPALFILPVLSRFPRTLPAMLLLVWLVCLFSVSSIPSIDLSMLLLVWLVCSLVSFQSPLLICPCFCWFGWYVPSSRFSPLY